jgi:hypothetical protein
MKERRVVTSHSFKYVCRRQGKQDIRGSRISRSGGKNTAGLLVCLVHSWLAFAGICDRIFSVYVVVLRSAASDIKS